MHFTKQSCEEFVAVLASREPVPGGGGASALVGAVGIALGNMAGSLTVGKEKYASVQEDIKALKDKANALQAELLLLVSKDAEAFKPLAEAYGMPKDTEAQKAEKARVMESALRTACAVPLEIMERCCEAIELLREFAGKCAVIALSDAGVGAALCKAALLGASLNVYINTKSMRDREYAQRRNAESDAMLEKYTVLADAVYTDVLARLR